MVFAYILDFVQTLYAFQDKEKSFKMSAELLIYISMTFGRGTENNPNDWKAQAIAKCVITVILKLKKSNHD